MTIRSSVLVFAGAAALVALLALIGTQMGWPGLGSWTAAKTEPQPATTARTAPGVWAASAPGRVEPLGGEVRVTATAPGRIVEIAVKVGDTVKIGDLLLRLDEEDARARLVGIDAEAAVRRRERDGDTAPPRLAAERRQAEDQLAVSERLQLNARTDLDRIMRENRAGKATDQAVADARKAVLDAIERADRDRAALTRAQTATGVPLPTRLEAALTTTRSEVALAEAALERMRVRAPADGTVLQVQAKVGETAAANPEQILIVVGNISALRVRAEVEERDVAKVKVGQAVVLRTDAYPGREFTGRVATLARSLTLGRLAQRGPRRPTDVDTLEVMIDIDAGSPLLPGMRTDVFFRAEAPEPKPQAATPPGPPVTATK